MTHDSVVLTRALTKTYGDAEVVRGLDLSVRRNQITAFLGRNGAGKSTTIKMLLGMVRPTSGEGFVLGKRITDPEENRKMRRGVAFVAENKPLYDYMRVEQTIRFARSFYPDWRSDVEKHSCTTMNCRCTGRLVGFQKECELNSLFCLRLLDAQSY